MIAGGRGNDTAFLGAGNDAFVWNPGDGRLCHKLLEALQHPVYKGLKTPRNAAISRHFERDPIPYALETDWPVGAGGFEPLHPKSIPLV
jgi:hypothetical protein